MSIRPLDRVGSISFALRNEIGRVVSIETGWHQCGLGSEICSYLIKSCLDAPFERDARADVQCLIRPLFAPV